MRPKLPKLNEATPREAVKQGQIWIFERDRPSRQDDPRTPYRVIVSANYRLPPERRWILTAPVVSALDIDTPVAVRLGTDDPAQGWIRADEVSRTYVPWLTDLVGAITATTREALAAALRTEMDL